MAVLLPRRERDLVKAGVPVETAILTGCLEMASEPNRELQIKAQEVQASFERLYEDMKGDSAVVRYRAGGPFFAHTDAGEKLGELYNATLSTLGDISEKVRSVTSKSSPENKELLEGFQKSLTSTIETIHSHLTESIAIGRRGGVLTSPAAVQGQELVQYLDRDSKAVLDLLAEWVRTARQI